MAIIITIPPPQPPDHNNVQLLGENFLTGSGPTDEFSYVINPDGTIDRDANGSPTAQNPWWIPAPQANIGNFYEFRYTIISGVANLPGSATAGVWYSMSSSLFVGIVGFQVGEYLFEIRDAATQTIRAPAASPPPSYKLENAAAP